MSDTDAGTTFGESTPYTAEVSEGQPVSLAVIDALATVSDRPPVGDASTANGDGSAPLEPLYEAIDPDALDSLCRPTADDGRAPTTVSFVAGGYDVTVDSTGQITVTES